MKFIAKRSSEAAYTIPPSSTIIVSIPSHGNVGQLCTDIIISTLAHSNQIERVGLIESHHVLPMTGYEIYCDNWGATLCLPIEVYAIHETNVIVIHQRSPCLSNRYSSYSAELNELLTSFKPNLVCFLFGFPRYDDIFIDNPKKNSSFYISQLVEESIVASLEEQQLVCLNDIFLGSEVHNDDHNEIVLLARYLLLQSQCKVLVIGRSCDEGNNIADGFELYKCVKNILRLPIRTDARLPKSLEVAFGPGIPEDKILF